MELSNDIIVQFAKLTTSNKKEQKETVAYGTLVISDGKKYVRLDGSNIDTPVSSTTGAKNGDRVIVTIKNHEAIVTGNITSPSASQDSVDDLDGKTNNLATQVSEFGVIVSYKITTDDIDAINAHFETLKSISGKFEELDAVTAEIETLQARFADIEQLNAEEAKILNAEIDNLKVKIGEFSGITTEDLEAFDAEIVNLTARVGNFTYLSTEKLEAIYGQIEDLDTKKLSAEQADVKYANIDFANISEAAIVKIFSESGIIKDLIVSEGHITGELVGVTIKGDLIEGNTIKADKLVVKGSDGIFYKLNFEGGNFESAEEVPDEGLHGDVIIANTITAEKINVDDLVAFGATIGGFHINTNAIYSGVKSSPTNTTRGIYQDTEGQFAIGDSNNFFRYYKDAEGKYRLEISAASLVFSTSGKNVEDIAKDAEDAAGKVKDLEDRVNSGEFKGEDAVLLRIESSRGTVFKNDAVATVLSAVIYRGSERITNSADMKRVFGNSAYLQWKWQRLDDETFGVLSSSDSRFGDNGFTFTLSPQDVDTKVTFMCELIV